jgi:hypothetical protein
VGKWAATVSITNLLALPVRLAQRFFRRQQIIVQPIVREDGARKKRIVDAGHADEPSTPTPAPRARASLARRFPNNRASSPSSPSIWSPSPSAAKTNSDLLPVQLGSDQIAPLFSPNLWSPSSGPAHDIAQDDSEDNSIDMDDSLDFSLSDALCSDTPPFSRTPISFDEPAKIQPRLSLPKIRTPANVQSGRPDTVENVSSLRSSNQGTEKISTNTHRNIIKKASVTPMRKKLLRLQIGAKGSDIVPTSSTAHHTNPTFKLRAHQQPVHKASNPRSNAAAIAHGALEASEQYSAQAEARQNSTTDIPAARRDEFNLVETIDQDHSWLSDAPDYDEADQTLHSPLRPTQRKRSVRWDSHAGAKPFFCDETIADMMDSTLETIIFSPVRPSLADEVSEDNTSEDDAQDASDLSPTVSRNQSKTRTQTTPSESVGFTGVPASTWEDSEDSIDESQISLELLEDLQQDLQKKLALAPTPPPPPPVKALVAPLSSEEQETLDAAATKTDNGKNSSMWVVDQKLYARDFGTLLPHQFNGDPKAWLNDNIVNEYLSILTAGVKKRAGFEHKRGGGAPPVHAFSSFWYSTIKSRPKGVERWAARFQLAGSQYLDAEVILYPICDAGHWRLLAVKPKDRVIEYLDSLGWSGTKYIDTLKEYLAKELGDAWVSDEWTVIAKQRSTRQLNGSDCGVFTILNALSLLRGEEFTKVLACDGMPDARERIAITLMKGTPTTELE